MPRTKNGRRIALLAGVVVVLVIAPFVWVNWDRIRFLKEFESIGKNPQGYPEYRHRKTGIVFVWLPGGQFTMGIYHERNERYGNVTQGPLHEVILSPFLIAKHEVTQAEWEKVMGSNPSWSKGPPIVRGGGQWPAKQPSSRWVNTHPVDQVTWEDCQQFCSKTGLSFPTEAQYEYACRAGKYGRERFDLFKMGWYKENSGRTSHPVGQKEPNEFGLYDMHGNVREWCQDVYDEKFYSKTARELTSTDPLCTSGSEFRVLRGGSWVYPFSYSHAWIRDKGPESHSKSDVGFRPAWSWP